jgi:hypothetical protein
MLDICMCVTGYHPNGHHFLDINIYQFQLMRYFHVNSYMFTNSQGSFIIIAFLCIHD